MPSLMSVLGSRPAVRIAGAFGALTVLCAVAALLVWARGAPETAAAGSVRLLMAPSSALLFAALGAAVAAARGAVGRRAAAVIGAAATAAALVFLALSWRGTRFGAGSFGIDVMVSASDASAGAMSPVTAFAFLCAGVSLLAALAAVPGRVWLGRAAAGFAAIVLFGAVDFGLAYLFGAPLLYQDRLIPPAVTTTLAFAALGAGLLAFAIGQSGEATVPWDAASRRSARTFAIVFALVAVCLIAAGALYSRFEVRSRLRQVEADLYRIGRLKAAGVERWRAERLRDAAYVSRNADLAALARGVLAAPRDEQAKQRFASAMQLLREIYRYRRTVLFGPSGTAVWWAPVGSVPATDRRWIDEVLRSGRAIMTDLHRDWPGDMPHVALLLPVDGVGGRAVGAIALRVDVGEYLYPYIREWPDLSKSGETLLVRREGDAVLYLNDLRFRKHTALALRIPLARRDNPAVQAVLGRTGFVHGRDYRGVSVLASVARVGGSPWYVVAKVDQTEARAPLKSALWLEANMTGALLLAIAAVTLTLWRQQRQGRAEARAREAELLAAAAARYEELFESVNDAIVTADARGTITGWNPAAERMFGYSRSEALGANLEILMPERSRDAHRAGLRRVRAGGERRMMGAARELVGLTRDGKEFPLELSLDERGSAERMSFTAVIRDVTERKRAELELRRQKDLYDVLSKTNEAIVHGEDRDALFHSVCRIAVEQGHFLFALVGLIDPGERRLKPVAYYGEDAGYVRQLDISLDSTADTGAGRTAQALRDGRPVIVNDLAGAEARSPSHWSALQADVRAYGAFPIRERGALVGTINVYAAQSGFFTKTLVATLQEIAADVSFALDNLQHSAERARQFDELRRWQGVMLGREERSLELKREVNGLLERLGEPERYPSARDDA